LYFLLLSSQIFTFLQNFRNIEAVDDQGNPIAGTTGGSVSVAAVSK
jgi:hypothetical protein